MIKRRYSKWILMSLMVFLAAIEFPATALGEENLALYGLKGYAYTQSPLASDGLHIQAGGMYSIYHKDNLRGRDGYIWAVPVSLTYGDGDWWEVAAATHWEHWNNTDFDVEERGLGDIFLGGKLRILGQDRGQHLDFAVMPYAMIPGADREESIGDLYLYNPTDDHDEVLGVNFLFGHRWDRVYFAFNVGVNHMDTDAPDVKSKALFTGLTLEYQICETLTSYLEFINVYHRNRADFPIDSPYHDEKRKEEIRELGGGLVWLKGKWAFKAHLGTGFTETSPDLRAAILINRLIAY